MPNIVEPGAEPNPHVTNTKPGNEPDASETSTPSPHQALTPTNAQSVEECTRSALTYFQYMHEDREGYLCIATRSKTGRFQQAFFAWPSQGPEAAAYAATRGPLIDVYSSVLLHPDQRRSAESALPGRRIWVDCDDDPDGTSQTWVMDLHGVVVNSGGEGRFHGYLPLLEESPAGVLSELSRLFALAIQGDRKWDASSVLRPPGTFHHKQTPPRPVTLVMPETAFAGYPAAELKELLLDAARTHRSFVDVNGIDRPLHRRPSLEELIASPPSPGGRNTWLASVCGHLAILHPDDQDAYERSAFAAIFSLPDLTDFPDEEARRTIESIWNREQRQTVDLSETSGRRIDIPGRTSLQLAQLGWEALLEANDPPTLFRNGGHPVRLERDDDGGPVLQSLTLPRMAYALSQAATWISRNRDGREARRDPPEGVVTAALATPDHPLPVLTRFVAAPVFAASGELQETPGYHPASRTFYAPTDGMEFRLPPERPSDGDIAEARRLIVDELICDFPFAEAADRAHAVALYLLPFVRELIDGQTPLHLFDKPTPGTGAGRLAEVLLIPALGRAPASMSQCVGEDEWRKRLAAVFKSALPVLMLDNLSGKLESSALAAALTQPIWGDRVLGVSDLGQWPVRTIFVATANNLQLSTDLTRRTVRVRLDAKMERPWERTEFRHELPKWAYEHRSDLVWAALTIVRAWLDRGRPLGVTDLGSYTQWARIMGGLLSLIGIDGFLENLSDLYEEVDTEGASNRWFVGRWYSEYASEWRTISQLWPLAAEDDCPLDLGTGNDGARRHRLGLHLDRIRDRRFTLENGARVWIEKSSAKFHNQRRWRIATDGTSQELA